MRYRKKPVEIEAMQFLSTRSAEAIVRWMGTPPGFANIEPATGACLSIDIKTLEGTMRADRGDWIIRGVQGEFYPCKPDIFEATYEAVE